MNNKIAIIICGYNQEKLLKKCLDSLKKNTSYKNYKVFFVDDSGTGKYGRFVKKNFLWVDVIIKEKNTGFSSSNNLGIKKAIKKYNPDYFLLLNDDTEIIDKKWLEKITNIGNRENKIGILGCKVLNPDKSLQWPAWIKNHEDEIQEVSQVIGCCLMFKKKVSDKIGLLDEKFDPVYGEESDFCFRAKKAGFKIVYCPEAKIIHHGKSSTNKLKSDFVWYLQKKHGIRLEWLNHGIFNLVKFTFLHIGSAIFSKNPIKKLGLLFKAYSENIRNIKEISLKRKQRNNY